MNSQRDVIEKLGKSLIQHGKFNDRIYLMKLAKEDFPAIIDNIEGLALTYEYSKIFAKIPAWAKGEFVNAGYKEEAFIPCFYHGEEDVYFLGKYFSKSRIKLTDSEKIKDVLQVAREKGDERQTKIESEGQLAAITEKGKKVAPMKLKNGFRFEIADQSHVSEMAKVYAKVFKTYPFPIDDPNYLLKTMQEKVVYFSIWHHNKIVALSSSEMDMEAENVEMTDFATLPEYAGQGFALFLLGKMEEEMQKRGIKIAYTIARALSYGMNITFAKLKYKYSGTLVNNTNIGGDLESMNVWYKSL